MIALMSAKKKKAELRLYVEPSTDRLVKTLAGLTDQTVSELVENALKEYLRQKYQNLVEKHRLDQLDE